MKKELVVVTMAMAMTMATSTSSVFADESGDPMAVTLIAGPEEEEAEPVSLDDVKLGKEFKIEGFGNLTFTDYQVLDSVRYKTSGGWNTYESGEEADYVNLFADVLNTNVKPKDYLSDVDVKAIYDDTYEYAGWAYQINYDGDKNTYLPHENDFFFSINPMYTGHYVYGATLPNAVINGKEELRLELKIDGNEMTYYIRK